MTVYAYTEDERQAAEEMERDEEGLDESIYPVRCAWCEWTGMSDDCAYLRCPSCGARVTREF